MIASSLGVFVLLYVTLGVVDFVLMRRYARMDPPDGGCGTCHGWVGARARLRSGDDPWGSRPSGSV